MEKEDNIHISGLDVQSVNLTKINNDGDKFGTVTVFFQKEDHGGMSFKVDEDEFENLLRTQRKIDEEWEYKSYDDISDEIKDERQELRKKVYDEE